MVNTLVRAAAALLIINAMPRNVVAASTQLQPLTAAVVHGSTVYGPLQLFATYRGRLGSDAGAAARPVMSGIEAMYERDGYIRPRIDVLDDLLSDGILRIEIHEVHLTDVVLEGDAGPYGPNIAPIVANLTEEMPLRQSSIPDALSRLQALPGLTVDAKVAEDPAVAGAAVLRLRMKFRQSSITVAWSHRGTEEAGPDFISLQATGHNLLHGAERIGVFATIASRRSEYRQVGGFLDIAVGGHNSVLSVGMSRSNSQPTFDGTQYALFYPQESAQALLSSRINAGDDLRLTGTLGIGYNDASIEYEGLLIEADRLRAAFLGIGLDGSTGNAGAYSLAMRWRRGLDAFGARIDYVDGSTVRPDYNIGTLNAVFAQPIGSRWRLRAEAALQSSSQRLPYVEQFKVGGAQLGRGLGTAIMAGDSGAGGSLELRYFVPGAHFGTGKLSAYGYSDYGTVWKRDVENRQYVGTAGFGIAVESRSLQFHLEAGRPVIFRDMRPDGTSLFAGAQYRF